MDVEGCGHICGGGAGVDVVTPKESMIFLGSLRRVSPTGSSSIAVTSSRILLESIPKLTGATRRSLVVRKETNWRISASYPVGSGCCDRRFALLRSSFMACPASVCSSLLGETTSVSADTDSNRWAFCSLSLRLLTRECTERPELDEASSSRTGVDRLGVRS